MFPVQTKRTLFTIASAPRPVREGKVKAFQVNAARGLAQSQGHVQIVPDTMASPLKKLRYRLEWMALVLLAKIVPQFSRAQCCGLAEFLGACAFHLDRRGRRIALSNLEAALGDELSPVRRKEVARESYQQFLRTMLDLFWVPRLTSENFERMAGDRRFRRSSRRASSRSGDYFYHVPLWELRMGRPASRTQQTSGPDLDAGIQESIARADLR